MTDHVSPEKRSQMMAAVKGKNTQPEYAVRRLLHKAGYRYRLHVKELSGKPDIVLPKYKAVIFVHGCFWHGHGCNLSKSLPKTRQEFWKEKIERNKKRDEEAISQLRLQGWRVCVVWGCALERQGKITDAKFMRLLSTWIKGKKCHFDVAGQSTAKTQKQDDKKS